MAAKLTKDEIRQAAEDDLEAFIRLVAPKRLLGHVHSDLISWWTRSEALDNQLVLLPRGHQKSAMIAYRVAWEITRNPAVTILYASVSSGLAELQLSMIKDILTSPVYRRYWPDMVLPEEGKREKWTNTEIKVDHPLRKSEGIRDATVRTAGLGTSIVGFHCDIFVLDDIVTDENAYKADLREQVARAYAFFASIENPGAKEWVVGTRYDPNDLYGYLQSLQEDVYDEQGELIDTTPTFEVFERVVEDRGDGTGDFLWPRTQRGDGKWFGFNQQVLAKIRAKYKSNPIQYRAQYYNDPNSVDTNRINRDQFQYYDKQHLALRAGVWYHKNQPLSIYASVDFAYSLRKRADFTAIVVIGIDPNGNIYILDIDRFKTDRISEYWEHIQELHLRWDFRKLRAEVVAAQAAIVKELKEQYLRPSGLALKIEEYRPPTTQSKEDRILQVLESRYDNGAIWHYRSGGCQILEEELILAKPPHDDVKDALASAVDIAVPPRALGRTRKATATTVRQSRFGGA